MKIHNGLLLVHSLINAFENADWLKLNTTHWLWNSGIYFRRCKQVVCIWALKQLSDANTLNCAFQMVLIIDILSTVEVSRTNKIRNKAKPLLMFGFGFQMEQTA